MMHFSGRVLLASCVLVGCADAPAQSDPSATTSRDSAGVTIAESRTGTDARATITLDSTPVLQIGAVEGAPEYQLHRVRSVARQSDGTIVVANGGSQEIRFYDATGTFLRANGRPGDGPGEFRNIDYMRVLDGDSVLVFDPMNRRLTLLAPDGAYVRDQVIGADEERVTTVSSADAAGNLLTRRFTFRVTGAERDSQRDTLDFAILRDGTSTPIGEYAGAESRINISGEGGEVRSVSIARLPFTRGAFASAARDRFWIGSNDTYELHAYDAAGVLKTIVRRTDVPVREVTSQLREEWISERLAEIEARGPERPGAPPPDIESIRSSFEALPHAPTVPAYDTFVARQDGGVWVREYELPGTSRDHERWIAYGPDGRLDGTIDLPRGFRPMHIDADIVMGVIQDDIDVEYVRVYRLMR